MKFGYSLRNEIAKALPEWENEFISYKELKKQLNLIAQQAAGEGLGFISLLDSELEKVNEFFIEKEEEYIIRVQELKERVVNMESSGDRTQVKLNILKFHREVVLLLPYRVLNFAGLLKVVKKHKNTGISICMDFMLEVLQQPFFTTDLICKL